MSEQDVTGQTPEPQQQSPLAEMADYPEHDKLNAVQPKSQVIGEFLELCLPMLGVVLAEVTDRGDLYVSSWTTQRLLAKYFDIDLDKLDAEKRDMLARIRAGAKPVPEPTTDKPWFDADEPRVWRWENEADRVEPEGVTEVQNGVGKRFWLDDSGRWTRGTWTATWAGLLTAAGELTEVVPPAQGGAR